MLGFELFISSCSRMLMQEVREAGRGPVSWPVPLLRRPSVCDQLEPENHIFVDLYKNHPCRFLSD